MIIELYRIILSCDNYNIDINDSATITVQCIDYDNQPVVGKELTITSEKGFFNGESDAVVTTNSNGIAEIVYIPTDWGYDTIYCEDKNIQIRCKGWKENTIKTGLKLFYDNDTVVLVLNNLNIASKKNTAVDIGTISDSSLYPITQVESSVFKNKVVGKIRIRYDGKIQYTNYTDTRTFDDWLCVWWMVR